MQAKTGNGALPHEGGDSATGLVRSSDGFHWCEATSSPATLNL
jgi:hypothetical protein